MARAGVRAGAGGLCSFRFVSFASFPAFLNRNSFSFAAAAAAAGSGAAGLGLGLGSQRGGLGLGLGLGLWCVGSEGGHAEGSNLGTFLSF